MMRRFPKLVFPILLGLLAGSPALGQSPADSVLLRVVYSTRSDRLEELRAARHAAVLELVAVSHEVVSLPRGSGRRALLRSAQELADRIASLDAEVAVAAPAVREARNALVVELEAGIVADREAARAADRRGRSVIETRIREREAEVAALRGAGLSSEAPGPMATATAALSALAGIVTDEHARLMKRHALQGELRLFLGSLRLFDETGMPPAARSEGGGDPDPSCPVSACPITGLSPADVPLAHARPHDETGRDGTGSTSLTLASLARLNDQLARLRDLPVSGLATEPGVVTREAVVGTSAVGFRSGGERLLGVGPKVGASWLYSRPLAGQMRLTVEPSLGGRAVRADPTTAAEVAAELRETVAGAAGDGRLRWQVMSWQKGRFLSDPLPLPGYLEPGRLEVGLSSRVAIPVGGGWDVAAGGGGDLVRYRREEWKVLDRHGLNGSVGAAWHGASRSGRIAMIGSYHTFPGPGLLWEPRREDVRVGLEADGSFEGRVVARVSAGVAWNDSRLPAYDYRSARAAVVLSAPWGAGSVQGYGALARQVYQNPGPEEARVAPSDQDTGSMVAVQFARPLTDSRTLVLRAEWSRSESGFRSDFYHRLGTSIQLTFRGMGPVQRLE
jgi:hypothetical protein